MLGESEFESVLKRDACLKEENYKEEETREDLTPQQKIIEEQVEDVCTHLTCPQTIVEEEIGTQDRQGLTNESTAT